MDRPRRYHELVAGAEREALALLVEHVAASLQHVPAVVHVVPVEGQLLHPLRDVGRGPEVEALDVLEHLFLGREGVVDNLHRSRFQRHGLLLFARGAIPRECRTERAASAIGGRATLPAASNGVACLRQGCVSPARYLANCS